MPAENSSNASEQLVPLRLPLDNVEIVSLSIIVTAAIALNSVVFIQLLKSSRFRAPTARTNFLAGPYHLTSFTLFKLNLCITDFIILAHGIGKIIWILNIDWRFGVYSCKFYMFISALGFYANSNVIVAIGLDRLKVVYTSHVQGATSRRRVQSLISGAWALAIICALPQLFVWDIYPVTPEFNQCVSFLDQPARWPVWLPMLYEMLHQAAVFWIPFSIIFVCYFLIVIRLLHYTFTPKKIIRSGKSSHSNASCREIASYAPLRLPISNERLLPDGAHPEKVDSQKLPLSIWLSAPTTPKKISTASDPGPRTMEKKKKLRVRLTGFSAFTREGSLPIWRRQLRSRIFLTALVVVAAHCMMWLPYNLISTLRMVDEQRFREIAETGGNLLEDLIILNSFINPLLYSSISLRPIFRLC
ncbi:unnamed protein product, partial [Mesorhabditis spiculigera]